MVVLHLGWKVTGERAFSAYHLSLRHSCGGPAGDDGPVLRDAGDHGPPSVNKWAARPTTPHLP